MESTMMHASDLPDPPAPLSVDEVEQFAKRHFHPTVDGTSLRKGVRMGFAVTKSWRLTRCRFGWVAARFSTTEDGAWKGQKFPTATAAWVDAELRNWGEP